MEKWELECELKKVHRTEYGDNLLHFNQNQKSPFRGI